jgi:hypothetical protein
MRVRPVAIKAYTEPVRTPSMIECRTAVPFKG